jgi:integrase/recombinase XerD
VTTPPNPSTALVPVSETPSALALPDIVRRAGQPAVFAAEEFFYGAIRNEHTRAAYRRAVDQFLAWCEQRGLELPRIAPGDVGQYFDGLRKKNLSIATRKQHLAAVRHFFDGMVTRHAVILNPALSVRGERYGAQARETGSRAKPAQPEKSHSSASIGAVRPSHLAESK